MPMLMCRSCGTFVSPIPDGETLVPVTDECPECGGTEFKDNENDEFVRTD